MSSHKSESISLTRILTGAPDRVFDAWVNPPILQQWLGPRLRSMHEREVIFAWK